jgi:predicted nucleic acid-binding protein
MAKFVDTFFVIALTNRHDQFHNKAQELAEVFNRQSLVVTDAVLLEIGNTLSARFRSQAIQTIEDFLESDEVEIVRLDAELFERAFCLFIQAGFRALMVETIN